MNEIHDENGQFKMRLDDDVEDTLIPAQVDDMRIEKLNHKMTLISIMIPVFLVVVLVIAYLDIKKRVVRTEDTGSFGVQTLSQDMESRFSSLSLNQATIVEDMARLSDRTNQSMAKVQVNLKKLEESLTASLKPLASRKDIKAAAKTMDKKLANVSQSVEEVNTRVVEVATMTQSLEKMTQSLEKQMDQLRQEIGANKKALQANKGLVTQLEESFKGLDEKKIDRDALDLAIKLEVLRIKQSFKAQLDELQERVKTLESRPVVPVPKPQTAPLSDTTAVPKAPELPQTTSSDQIEEQTIGR